MPVAYSKKQKQTQNTLKTEVPSASKEQGRRELWKLAASPPQASEDLVGRVDLKEKRESGRIQGGWLGPEEKPSGA